MNELRSNVNQQRYPTKSKFSCNIEDISDKKMVISALTYDGYIIVMLKDGRVFTLFEGETLIINKNYFHKIDKIIVDL
jgi:hypothetical protein